MTVAELIIRLHQARGNLRVVYCHPDSGWKHDINNLYFDLDQGNPPEQVVILSDQKVKNAF